MEFRQGQRVMKVNRTAYGSSPTPYGPDRPAERVVFRGTIGSKPYVFDVQTMPASSPGGFLSIAGTKPDTGGLRVRWGTAPKGWQDGMTLDIIGGPLPGAWDAICRG